ncbi:MAG: acyl-CoA thioesterase [Sphingobacteriia bacterium]|jgi:acyl-CoA thioesterase YciA|nr:acyl-CoA thioesterase [Sphingobacteriia bacterium]
MKLITQKICMTKDLGIHGNLFGGILLSWLDEAGAALATEFCHSPNVVTLKIEEMLFKRPVKTGQQIRIYGEIDELGRSSVRLRIEARKYNLYSGEETVVCTTRITFVRIDEDGMPTPIGDTVRKRYLDSKSLEIS